jgi:hypothetical protein
MLWRSAPQGEVSVDAGLGDVTMSKIFKWYEADFPKGDALLRWLSKYLQPGQAADLESLLASGRPINISYKPYDWTTNAAE